MALETRVNSLQATRRGLERFVRYPQILISAYALNILSALLLVAVPALLLIKPAHYTAIAKAADGIDTWLVSELILSISTYPVLEGLAAPVTPDWLSQGLLVIAGIFLIMPFVVWIPGSFFAGGTLLTYVEAPARFSWRRFLWGCWHWFGAFLLANLILGIATQILLAVMITVVAIAPSTIGSWINWIVIPIVILVIVLWLMILEYTRLIAVYANTRNIFKAFWDAVVLVFRRLWALLGFYALSLLILLFTHVIFRNLLLSEVASWGLVFLVVSQIFIMARLSLRLIRWAGAVDLYQKSISKAALSNVSRELM